MKNSLLTINDLSLTIDDKPLLKNVNLRLERGEIGLLIGLNGCGKTTLLNTIAGLNEDFEGEILVSGVNQHNIEGKRRAKMLSYLPQFPEVHEAVYVEEYLDMCRYAFDYPCEKELFKYWSEQLDMERFFRRRMGSLSGGELRKCALLGCLVQKPKLLLLDEPFQHLDPHNKKALLSVLKEVQKDGVTILLVSHDFLWTQGLADRFFGIKDQKLTTGQDKAFFENVLSYPFKENKNGILLPAINEGEQE